MTAEHNHEPWCCCTPLDAHELHTCPACPEHGTFAAVECTQCHQPAGRPHTDYCKLAPGQTATVHPGNSRYWSDGEPVDQAELDAHG